ncbi:MAG: nitroreductase family protein [Firmicutes bacterium]|nr:nitroreductase family protein [Bacillota bacterium]
MNTDIFLEALKNRRTYYHLDKDIPVTPERVREIVERAAVSTPSAFNMQSARAVILFGAQSGILWNIAKDTLRKIVPEAAFPSTEAKLDSFAAGSGTILYFEDMDIVGAFQEKFSTYRDNFPVWSQQASGMLQSNIWTALELEGLGASLQHYNPLIDAAVKAAWNLPESWKLIAQMPFGKPVSPPDAKESVPAGERVRVFG